MTRCAVAGRDGILIAVTLIAAVVAAACGDSTTGTNPPPPPPPGPDPAIADIENQIGSLFSAADAASALTRFDGIITDVHAGRTSDAETKLIDFLAFTLDKLEAGVLEDPNGGAPPTIEEALATLTNDLFDFAGTDGPVVEAGTFEAEGAAEVVGAAGATVVTGTELAGVDIPPGVFSAPTLVAITRLPVPGVKGTGPLPTTQPQYPLFYEFASSRAPGGAFTVGICVLEDPPEPLGAPTAVFPDLRLAHPDPVDPQSIEVLPLAAAAFLDCADATAANVAPRGARSTEGPGTTTSGGALRGRGLGGLATSFSPFGAVVPPVASTSVSGGQFHTCGLTGAGAIYCWGQNHFGQLGNGTTVSANVPVAVAGGLTFQSVSVGGWTSCGLTTAGEIYCWGQNQQGQFGNGGNLGSSVPVAGGGGLTFRSISVGEWHACAITTAGVAYCWGTNFSGQLGDGTNTDRFSPVAVAGGLTFQSVNVAGAVGGDTCGVTTAGVAYCWGSNVVGQLGNGTTADSNIPVAVTGGLTFRSVDAGGGFSCGLATTGAAHCWGQAPQGQLGNGTTTNSSVPVAVLGGHAFRSVSSGRDFSCGVRTDGAAYCWGPGDEGRLGNGSTAGSTVPVAVVGGLTFARVNVAVAHGCGVTGAGAVYCWGVNDVGQLGNGTNVNSFVPVRVGSPF